MKRLSRGRTRSEWGEGRGLEKRNARMKFEMTDTSKSVLNIVQVKDSTGQELILILTRAAYGPSDKIPNLPPEPSKDIPCFLVGNDTASMDLLTWRF